MTTWGSSASGASAVTVRNPTTASCARRPPARGSAVPRKHGVGRPIGRQSQPALSRGRRAGLRPRVTYIRYRPAGPRGPRRSATTSRPTGRRRSRGRVDLVSSRLPARPAGRPPARSAATSYASAARAPRRPAGSARAAAARSRRRAGRRCPRGCAARPASTPSTMIRAACSGGMRRIFSLYVRRALRPPRSARTRAAAFAQRRVGDVRPHAARMHDRHPDAVARVQHLRAQALGEPADGELRRAVVRHAACAKKPLTLEMLMTCPSPEAIDVRQERLRPVDDAPEVHAEHPLVVLVLALEHGAREGDAGVVVDLVHDAVVLGDGGGPGLHRVAVGDVDHRPVHVAADGRSPSQRGRRGRRRRSPGARRGAPARSRAPARCPTRRP